MELHSPRPGFPSSSNVPLAVVCTYTDTSLWGWQVARWTESRTRGAAVEQPHLPDDEHGHLECLLVIEARIELRAVSQFQVCLAHGTRSSDAFGNGFARQLNVHSAQTAAACEMDIESLVQFAQYLVKAAGVLRNNSIRAPLY